MYTQALNSSDGDERHVEDAERAAQFQARIDADERIEPCLLYTSPSPRD